MAVLYSLLVVQHLHRGHESTHAHLVVRRLANLFGLVVHSIELANLVTVANGFKECLDGGTVSERHKVGLLDTHLGESGWEEQINGLWLVSVVAIVSHRTHLFVRDVHANGRAAKCTVGILRLADLVSAILFCGLGEVGVRGKLTVAGLAADALGCVPVKVSSLLTENVVLVLLCLALTKILNSAKHVLCNGFLILDDLLNDDSLGEGLVDALGHDGLSRTVEQSLLAVTESVGLDIARSSSDAVVGLPVVVSGPLLARAEVTVRLLVHLLRFALFLVGALVRVEDILSVHGDTSGNTVGVLGLLDLFGQVVASLVGLTERFTHGTRILAFLRVVEFVSQAIKVLSLDHNINWVGALSLTAESVALWQIGLSLLKARVHHDLAGSHVVGLSVLLGVGRCSEIAPSFVAVLILTDRHIGIVATSGDNVTSSANLRDGVSPHLGCRFHLALGCNHAHHF